MGLITHRRRATLWLVPLLLALFGTQGAWRVGGRRLAAEEGCPGRLPAAIGPLEPGQPPRARLSEGTPSPGTAPVIRLGDAELISPERPCLRLSYSPDQVIHEPPRRGVLHPGPAVPARAPPVPRG